MYSLNRYPNWIGFEDIFSELDRMTTDATKKVPNWPPYNIRKLGEDQYAIEIACAGFGKTDIQLTTTGNELVIVGEIKTDPTATYLHKGIAERSFERSFTLAESVVVKNASMVNGMLKVFLEHIIPDAKKPKTIPVDDDIPTIKDDRQLLTE